MLRYLSISRSDVCSANSKILILFVVGAENEISNLIDPVRGGARAPPPIGPEIILKTNIVLPLAHSLGFRS